MEQGEAGDTPATFPLILSQNLQSRAKYFADFSSGLFLLLTSYPIID